MKDTLPVIGQLLRRKSHTFVWAACEGCGKERWVQKGKRGPVSKVCVRCSIIQRHALPIIQSLPTLGELRHSKQIGRPGYRMFRWAACEGCGKERWADVLQKIRSRLCHKCGNKINRGKRNHNWRGGRRRTDDGYIEVLVYDDDQFYPMATVSGYVREHRLIVARRLGRCLLPWEIVHHKNGKRDDNTPANLELRTGDADHVVFALAELTMLRKENAALKLELSKRK